VIVKWGSPPKFHGDPDILIRRSPTWRIGCPAQSKTYAADTAQELSVELDQ